MIQKMPKAMKHPMKPPEGGMAHVLIVGVVGGRSKPAPRRDRRDPGPQPKRRTT